MRTQEQYVPKKHAMSNTIRFKEERRSDVESEIHKNKAKRLTLNVQMLSCDAHAGDAGLNPSYPVIFLHSSLDFKCKKQ